MKEEYEIEKKYIYDLETYINMFLGCFKSLKTGKVYNFEISDRKDDSIKLYKFLSQENLVLIGFNNVNFDYPVIHNTLLSHHIKWTAQDIYNESQQVITSEWSAIKYNEIKIPQIDLYKIWHYDNQARRTSLKSLEIALRMDNIEDLPYDPSINLTSNQMDEIISYCHNDIEATYQFYLKSIEAIEFRKQMSLELNHNVMNYSDVKIGEYINRITYEKISGRNYYDFKDDRTYRNKFNISELIPSFIKFNSKYLNDFLDEIKTQSFNNDENFIRDLNFAGIELTFAKGGLHSKDKPLDIKCNDNQILQEKDVGGMYPASIINNQLYPKHLGKEWYLGIKQLYDERNDILKPKLKQLKKGSEEYKYIDSKQGAFKLSMNGGGYGKTGSSFSWQYDPMVIMRTTFIGQLSLIMLIEQLYEVGVKIISANTDGVVIIYDIDIKPKVDLIHKEWEKVTGYLLEDTNYSRIIFRDVNNYLAFICDENKKHLYYKHKGCFEIDCDFHKNHSKRIVAIALSNYYINNISFKQTIYNHLNNIPYLFCKNYGIFDFCLAVKMTGQNKLFKRIKKTLSIIDEKLSKVTRYYISNEGNQLIKKLPPLEKSYLSQTDLAPDNQMNIFDIIEDNTRVEPKDRETNIEVGYLCTVFNRFVDKENYNINYDYYINECNKIIKNIN